MIARFCLGQEILELRVPEVGEVGRCQELIDVARVDVGVRPPAPPRAGATTGMDAVGEAFPPGVGLVGASSFKCEKRSLRSLMSSDPLLDEWSQPLDWD